MTLKSGILAFEWDKGNLDKSRRKHGVTPEEAESAFTDENGVVLPDAGHSEKEKRHIRIGRSDKERHLFIVFTIRDGKVRIISARRMHQKEAERYEKTQKDTKI